MTNDNYTIEDDSGFVIYTSKCKIFQLRLLKIHACYIIKSDIRVKRQSCLIFIVSARWYSPKRRKAKVHFLENNKAVFP